MLSTSHLRFAAGFTCICKYAQACLLGLLWHHISLNVYVYVDVDAYVYV